MTGVVIGLALVFLVLFVLAVTALVEIANNVHEIKRRLTVNSDIRGQSDEGQS